MRTELPLEGVWDLSFQHPSNKDLWTTIPGDVPGNVAMDLHRAGLLPDPYVAENFRSCEWAASESFFYRTSLELPAEASNCPGAELVFDGLDTYATIKVNGEVIGDAANMMMRHRFQVPRELLKKTQFNLEVEIKPPLQSARQWIDENKIDLGKTEAAFGITERPAMRKMQMSFGWDNTPFLLAGGIFRTPRLVLYSGSTLEDAHWHLSKLDEDLAVVDWEMEIDDAKTGQTISIAARCRDSHVAATCEVEGSAARLQLPIEQPYLWWPAGMGEPNLYEVNLELKNESGEVIDRRQMRIGLRVLERDTSVARKEEVNYRLGIEGDKKPDGGFSFSWSRVPLDEPQEMEIQHYQFKINGRPIFIRGANWQTPDIFPGCIDREKYEKQCQLALDANINLLRLWGGGVVEDDCFYEICTEKGLLVWQDFQFACARYPREAAFQKILADEIPNVVRRLRNHTSLVVWCGDNEHDMLEYDRGIDPEKNPVNKALIPDTLAALDKQGRPYHTSSPCGGPYPRSEWAGDRRNWGAWYPHRDYEHIRQDRGRFVSEGGSYALPSLPLAERAVPEAVRWPLGTRTWRLRSGDVDRLNRSFTEVNDECWAFFREPKNLAEAVEISQFAQAWGYKRLVEHCRRRREECGGIVLWKLNDCWPANDAGLLDWEQTPRLSYQFVREAYQPVAVSVETSLEGPYDGQLRIWLHNDSLEKVQGTVSWQWYRVGADLIEEIGIAGTEEVEALPSKNVALQVMEMPDPQAILKVHYNDEIHSCETWMATDPAVALAYHESAGKAVNHSPAKEFAIV